MQSLHSTSSRTLHTEDGEKTFPKGTHLGGLGGGSFKLKDQSKVQDISLPFVFPEGDRSEIQYVGFETAADIKRSNIFNMFTDAERHGHVNFSMAFHEISKNEEGDGWKLTVTKDCSL